MTAALLNSLSYVVSQITANRIIQYSPGKQYLVQYRIEAVKATKNIRIKTLEKEAKKGFIRVS